MRLRGMRVRLCLRRWRKMSKSAKYEERRAKSTSLDELHARYERQSRWFYGIRSNLLRRVAIHAKKHVLDLGCGTGVVTPELKRRAAGMVVRCDYDAEALRYMPSAETPGTAAEAATLPFPDRTFDLVFTQMFFMWVREVAGALSEISRVLQPGGHLVAAAEPDYGGRIEHPPALSLGPMLINSCGGSAPTPRSGESCAACCCVPDSRLRQEFTRPSSSTTISCANGRRNLNF